ncbi:uroporphyrin-III C-methyltransferase / precorrin-2 dehydrogenase / sirohydrochlorin ferrochelatase [Colwellia chukchiensis]|uniref:precorrin-2 dehydrogenase n=1 Tax=Colwellia chukchiensis TaxID=641665 RepID=A0A1H7SUK7_9GAMM|nr:NAD(P)-dependent oxidoreductase [Colwellia chukchiensis]SEL76290.1 uroporphyrin-III C-methyltransferase / precorrin-2 dehydrogenase / sirohydrochlorin ferrochelatase [Colwellia chukchiensis]
MKYFPIFLDAKDINAMIIGGGEVAARKIELLLKSTTQISIMAASLNPSVERLVRSHQLTWLSHNYQAGHLGDCNLVIAATDSREVNSAIAAESNQLKLLTNVVDQPELCNYITPAIIDRNPMIIAMSSSGSAPILLRMLREQIEKTLPYGYGKLADFSFKFREHVKARIKSMRERRTFWERTLRGPIGQAILAGERTAAEQELIASLQTQTPSARGEIVFIHTGNGNPDHLTLNAHREMQFADAVFYDQAVNQDIIEYIRRDASKFPQQVASEVLINVQHALELAEQGDKVIYLLHGELNLPENKALAASSIVIKHLYSGR